jgi:hypothetical protein
VTAPRPAQAYTTEQLLDGVHRALEARDMEAVAALLRRLAVQSPHDAQAVLDMLEFAKVVTR